MYETDYERGLKQLQDMITRRVPDRMTEFEVLELRLKEIFQEEHMHGSNENIRSRKSAVLYALATLTQEVVGTEEVHFIDLCQMNIPQQNAPSVVAHQSSPPEFSQSRERWSSSESEIMIQDVPYLLYETPPIEEIWSFDRSVVRRRAKAQQLQRNRIVWLKQVYIQQRSTTASAWYDALAKEGRLLEQLEDEKHHNFPRLLTISNTPQTMTLTYVFTVGNSLQQVFGPFDRPLEARRIAPLLQSMNTLCAMLNVLHAKHMAHRILTSENIVLVGGRNAVLQDVGLATQSFLLGENLSPYQAPEQLGLTHEIAIPGPHTDIYQLGALLYHMLTGQRPPPSHALPPSVWNSAISQELDVVLLKATAPLVKDRWRSISDFSKALRNVAMQSYSMR